MITVQVNNLFKAEPMPTIKDILIKLAKMYSIGFGYDECYDKDDEYAELIQVGYRGVHANNANFFYDQPRAPKSREVTRLQVMRCAGFTRTSTALWIALYMQMVEDLNTPDIMMTCEALRTDEDNLDVSLFVDTSAPYVETKLLELLEKMSRIDHKDKIVMKIS